MNWVKRQDHIGYKLNKLHVEQIGNFLPQQMDFFNANSITSFKIKVYFLVTFDAKLDVVEIKSSKNKTTIIYTNKTKKINTNKTTIMCTNRKSIKSKPMSCTLCTNKKKSAKTNYTCTQFTK